MSLQRVCVEVYAGRGRSLVACEDHSMCVHIPSHNPLLYTGTTFESRRVDRLMRTLLDWMLT